MSERPLADRLADAIAEHLEHGTTYSRLAQKYGLAKDDIRRLCREAKGIARAPAAPARDADPVEHLPELEWWSHKLVQLEAAIEHLKRRLAEEPMEVTPPPTYPDKSKQGSR